MNAIVRIVDENMLTGIASVDSTLKDLESKVIASYGNVKEQAIACMNLKNAMDSCDKFDKVKFPKFIDNRFNGAIKGTTAYKYAQTASIFSDNSDIWDMFNMGQIVELIALYERDKKKGFTLRKDCSFDDLCIFAGKELDKLTEHTYCEWENANATALAQIEMLKANGIPYDNISTTPEPAKSLTRAYAEKTELVTNEYANDLDMVADPEPLDDRLELVDAWYIDNIREIGYQWLIDCTTKDLRSFVSMYLESKGIKRSEPKQDEPKQAEQKHAEPEQAEQHEPTPEEIKETALKYLHAYIDILTANGETVPRTLANAVKTLEK